MDKAKIIKRIQNQLESLYGTEQAGEVWKAIQIRMKDLVLPKVRGSALDTLNDLDAS